MLKNKSGHLTQSLNVKAWYCVLIVRLRWADGIRDLVYPEFVDVGQCPGSIVELQHAAGVVGAEILKIQKPCVLPCYRLSCLPFY